MSKKPFEKFINKPVSGAKKKEAIRQEKKQVKAELRAKGEEIRKRNEERFRVVTSPKPGSTGSEQANKRAAAPAHPKTAAGKTTTSRTASPVTAGKFQARAAAKPFASKASTPPGRSSYHTSSTGQQYQTKQAIIAAPSQAKTTVATPSLPPAATPTGKRSAKPKTPASRYKKGQPVQQSYEQITTKKNSDDLPAEAMPLNKYIAYSGICGRREAAELVKDGKVTVNGDRVFEPGYKVAPTDKVEIKGKTLFLQKNLVYILVNKPKDYITTAKDPEGRKTILDLLKGATQERIYPVGRLDRNTTGVLLMTNDGELAQKLTHPSFEIKKVYEVTLDRPLVKKDFEAITQGVTLEDGFVAADAVGYADLKDKSVIGIEIHSGRNRIVRRIFEHLGYKVKNLDRVMFANLTKKNVDRGKWRFLSEKEVRLLKFMNQSFVRKRADAS